MTDTILAMTCDPAFDFDGTILPWIAHQATVHPDRMAQVVIRLATSCPMDATERTRNQARVLTERGDLGAIPRQCTGVDCGVWMVTRKYKVPHLAVANSLDLCTGCAGKQWRAKQLAAS